MRLAVFFQLRLRLSLQNTAELLNPDSLTQTGTKTGGWSLPVWKFDDPVVSAWKFDNLVFLVNRDKRSGMRD